DEVAQHLFSDLEVGDHPILQRPDGHDVGGRATDHALGLETDRERTPVLDVDGDDGRLVEDNAAAPDIDESVRRAQVDRHVPAEQGGEEAVGHAKRPTRPREVSARGYGPMGESDNPRPAVRSRMHKRPGHRPGKKMSISRLADSGESEPWTRFSVSSTARS